MQRACDSNRAKDLLPHACQNSIKKLRRNHKIIRNILAGSPNPCCRADNKWNVRVPSHTRHMLRCRCYCCVPRFSNRQLDIMMLISLVQRQSMGIKAWHWVRGDFRWHWRLRNDIWTQQMNLGSCDECGFMRGIWCREQDLKGGLKESFPEIIRKFVLEKCKAWCMRGIQLKSFIPSFVFHCEWKAIRKLISTKL